MDDHPQGPVMNLETFGRLLRAARIVAGHDAVASAPQTIEEKTGLRISERTIYAIERGEQMPTLEQFFAIVVALEPPGGSRFFGKAFREDLWSKFNGLRAPG